MVLRYRQLPANEIALHVDEAVAPVHVPPTARRWATSLLESGSMVGSASSARDPPSAGRAGPDLGAANQPTDL